MPRADEPRRTVRLAAEFDRAVVVAAGEFGCSHGALLREAAEAGLSAAIAARRAARVGGGEVSGGSGRMRGARAPSISRAARTSASPPILAPASAPLSRGAPLWSVVAERRGIPERAARRWCAVRGVLVDQGNGREVLHMPETLVDPAAVSV